jgi:hypothetical protein
MDRACFARAANGKSLMGKRKKTGSGQMVLVYGKNPD